MTAARPIVSPAARSVEEISSGVILSLEMPVKFALNSVASFCIIC